MEAEKKTEHTPAPPKQQGGKEECPLKKQATIAHHGFAAFAKFDDAVCFITFKHPGDARLVDLLSNGGHGHDLS